jgi:hypothetical protein
MYLAHTSLPCRVGGFLYIRILLNGFLCIIILQHYVINWDRSKYTFVLKLFSSSLGILLYCVFGICLGSIMNNLLV